MAPITRYEDLYEHPINVTVKASGISGGAQVERCPRSEVGGDLGVRPAIASRASG